jgi:hypothetical protein
MGMLRLHRLSTTTARQLPCIHCYGTTASLPWLRLDDHATTVLAWRPLLGGYGLAAKARWPRVDCYGPPRPQLDSCLASTATARRLRYHADGLTTTPPRSQLGGHGLAASGWRAWLHGHDSMATARLPRLDGTVLLLRLHGSTTPRLGCFASTTTVDGQSSPRPVDGHGHAATATARRPRLGDHDSTTTPGR